MMPSKRRYKMAIAGQLFKHLGLQMYSGAVPVITELISNAYDAMARNVWITLPTGQPIQQTDKITVKDDGHGMNHEECNSSYLPVGKDRRSRQSEWTQPYNGVNPRKVQGRKGIGKLAGFGIADGIEVYSIKEKKVACFALDYHRLTKSENLVDDKGYEPETLPEDNTSTEEESGTKITLSRLKIKRTIDEKQFRQSIARRLLVLDQNFKIHVNGQIISGEEIPFQFRFPESVGSWDTAELADGRQIQWWAGFCKDTIPDEEQRGFVVYVRGKLAQTPWFFDLSGGAWGQHGMQYLTGEIQADFLDEGEDLIATDRGAVRWEDPMAAPLKNWGRKKIRELLGLWADKRREKKIKSPKVKMYMEQAKKLPENERKIFNTVVDRICAIPQLDKHKDDRDITDELVEFVYNAMTNRSFLDTIRRLNSASPADINHFEEILSEWDIIEAVNTAHLVKGRVEIIQKFEQMIRTEAKEKPDMQNYLQKYPWLIDPKWTMLTHEKSLDRILREKFGVPSSKNKEGAGRPDFFCLGDNSTAHLVETKRPGYKAGREEFRQLENYVGFLRNQLQEGTTNAAHGRAFVKGLLIAGSIRQGEEHYINTKILDVRTWDDLLRNARRMHQEFFDVVKKRAPAEDPRIVELSSEHAENDPESESEDT